MFRGLLRLLHFCHIRIGRLDQGGIYRLYTSVGGGIWLQQEDTYRELSEGETLLLTEDRSLVCVSSELSVYTAWYYRGDSNTGTGERIVDVVLDQLRGFLTLTLPMSLPANRTGYYYCNSNEYNVTTGNTHSKQHSIRVSLPTGNDTCL